MVRGTFLVFLCSLMLVFVAPLGHADGGAPNSDASSDNTSSSEDSGTGTTSGSQPLSSAELFRDVPSGHWALEDLRFLVEYGVIIGLPNGEFRGEQPLTRYSGATMMARALRLMMNNPDLVTQDDLKALQELLFEVSNKVEQTDAQLQALASNTGAPEAITDSNTELRLTQTTERLNQAEATLLALQQDINRLKRNADAPQSDGTEFKKLKQQANANFILAIASLFVGIIGIALATMT